MALDADRRSYLAFRDGDGNLVLAPLAPDRTTVTVGRAEAMDIALPWDHAVSNVHAELRLMGGQWVLLDDGLSRNGTFVNDERVVGLRRLKGGDMIQIGRTDMAFRSPYGAAEPTQSDHDQLALRPLTADERAVLVELCRPLFDTEARFTSPAPNTEIAAHTYMSMSKVKGHLRAMAETYGMENLKPGAQRKALAEEALRLGLVSLRDL